ncbi:MAG: glutamate--tRNA ligase [bacterium]|nr:glutamate--tRNA ligase [bacterium]
MVRTRIAPSPTGNDIHIGNLYTALINWAFAKKNKGSFIIRIEDTDRTRLVEGAEEKILSSFLAYGLDYDEGPGKEGKYAPYRQSERLSIYKKHADELIQKRAAYYCVCTKERLDEIRKIQLTEKKVPRYDKHCLTNQVEVQKQIKKGTPYVIRLKVPEHKKIVAEDLLRGAIEFSSNDLDDQVLLKSDGYPTYHLAVVVDDTLMEITHVIRAEEWLSSTPKHILLYEAFGWQKPIFVHLPILRNPDRSKLSKRKNPVWASWYLEQGYLPEAVLNYLSLMGWSHPEGKEIFSLEEFIRVFELKDIKTSGPAFDQVKLEWMNGEYIRNMKHETLNMKLLDFIGPQYPKELVEKTIPLIQERIKKLSDYLPLTEFFFKRPEKYEIDMSKYKDILKKVGEKIETVTEWKSKEIGEAMQSVATEVGMKNSEFFMMLRVAITGKKISPPLNESMEILGKEESVSRVKSATTPES